MIIEKFAHLLTGSQVVIVAPFVPKEVVTAIRTELRNIDENVNSLVCRTDHLLHVPHVVFIIDNRIVSTPYRFN